MESFLHKKNYRTLAELPLITVCLLLLQLPNFVIAQSPSKDSNAVYKVVVAGKEYSADNFHQWFWGKHYREEWTQPVKVKVMNLDTVKGGLVASEKGGGRQTTSLRLKDRNGREYVLRSVDKDFGKSLPDLYRSGFINKVAKDQVSIGHPYAAVTIPPMAEAAGVYHTNPEIVYIPKQKALGPFNDEFGNQLYLFEERPDDNWKDNPSFGNSRNIVGTEKMFEKVFEDNDKRVDQNEYVRARLFDMFIGDWGRHDDQWRWAEFEDGKDVTFKPVPRDRDQAYSVFDGVLPSYVTHRKRFNHLQSFDYTIPRVSKYGFPARHLDRQLANEVNLQSWLNIALDLQQRLTDPIIEKAIRRLPPEIYAISGPTIIGKLKSRRDNLVKFAEEYYFFLAKEVDIAGTKGREYFEVRRLNDKETLVNIYKINKEGERKKKPFYSRTFKESETKEIRVYGLQGNDVYSITGDVQQAIKLRVIGGINKDSISDHSSVAGSARRTKVYDGRDNAFEVGGETDLELSDDPAVNYYNYEEFEYNTGKLAAKVGRYIGPAYVITNYKWRTYPFSYQQKLGIYYALMRKALYVEYTGLFKEVVARWDVDVAARYDMPFVENFYGIGNESQLLITKGPYNRTFSTGFTGSAGLSRSLANHTFGFRGIFQTNKVKNLPGRFISDHLHEVNTLVFNTQFFAGGGVYYQFNKTNNKAIPTRGVKFAIGSDYIKNLHHPKAIIKTASDISVYIPLSRALTFASRVGGATISGEPEFYQLNKLGGSVNLRGHQRERFYGKTAVYNNNEIRWLVDTRNYVFNGKIGMLVFLDNGRVWQPGEISHTWHTGYGAGLIIAPFNAAALTATYGMSKGDNRLELKASFLF